MPNDTKPGALPPGSIAREELLPTAAAGDHAEAAAEFLEAHGVTGIVKVVVRVKYDLFVVVEKGREMFPDDDRDPSRRLDKLMRKRSDGILKDVHFTSRDPDDYGYLRVPATSIRSARPQ